MDRRTAEVAAAGGGHDAAAAHRSAGVASASGANAKSAGAAAAGSASSAGAGSASAAAAPDEADKPGAGRWSGRIVRAGHADARFEFAIPAGLAPLRGVNMPAGAAERVEFESAQPEGVGIVAPGQIALNSIVVYSDPEGLGRDFSELDRDGRREIATMYGDQVAERFPGASPARIITLGSHLALRIDLPRVVMDNRPVRSGRHYLVFDQTATASIDCVWVAAEAARMERACDAVANQLRRVQ